MQGQFAIGRLNELIREGEIILKGHGTPGNMLKYDLWQRSVSAFLKVNAEEHLTKFQAIRNQYTDGPVVNPYGRWAYDFINEHIEVLKFVLGYLSQPQPDGLRRKIVMISSTAQDLPKHREQVRLACQRAGFEPREMMEHLTALNQNPGEISLRMVEEADVYLGILAYRYGTVPKGCDTSITEMEYNHAVKLGKPCLVFFIHKDHPVVIEDVETGPNAIKLKALKDRIGEQRVAAFFKSPDDIRSHVVEALTKLAKELDTAQRPTVLPLRTEA